MLETDEARECGTCNSIAIDGDANGHGFEKVWFSENEVCEIDGGIERGVGLK